MDAASEQSLVIPVTRRFSLRHFNDNSILQHGKAELIFLRFGG